MSTNHYVRYRQAVQVLVIKHWLPMPEVQQLNFAGYIVILIGLPAAVALDLTHVCVPWRLQRLHVLEAH